MQQRSEDEDVAEEVHEIDLFEALYESGRQRVEIGYVWHSAVEVLGNARRSVWTEASPVDIISNGSVSASISTSADATDASGACADFLPGCSAAGAGGPFHWKSRSASERSSKVTKPPTTEPSGL